MVSGIYCYIDKQTNEIVYIGKDSYIDKRERYKAHKRPSAYNEQQINRVIQNTPERYQYKVLEKGNISEKLLNLLEMSFIRKYNPKFNYTEGGEGVLGFKHSEETKKKISESLKGENNPLYGKHRSEETKKKISKAQKGKSLTRKHMFNMCKARNTAGYYRVCKSKNLKCKQGFCWTYRWSDKDGKRKSLSSIDIKKLEKKVKEKGLPWFKIKKER